MLKITATGNLTNDVELRSHEDGKPYAILRIASDRRYRDREGNKLTDFISIKVRGALAERCAAFAWKGCKLAASGDFETICFAEDPTRQPGFLIKANEVEFLSPRRVEESPETQTATQRSWSRFGAEGQGNTVERTLPNGAPQSRPSGFVGRGGARERTELSPRGKRS